MTLARLFGGVRRQWVALVLVLAAVLALSAAYAITRPVRYTATAQVFVRVASAQNDLTQLNQGGDYTHGQVASYVDLVTSPIVLQKVIRELRLPDSVAQLSGRIQVDNPLNTVLVNVTVSDPHPAEAAQIANHLVADFSTFVEQIETPDGRTTAPVAVSITRPATVPAAPAGTSAAAYLILGALLGLVLGVAVAQLRDRMNRSVRTAVDVEQVTGIFPLGVVPYDRRSRRRPMITARETSARAEVYRSLRTNLRYVDLDVTSKVIVVASARSGEGRTTAAYNLAATMAAVERRVIVVEADLRKPMLGRYLGIPNEVGLTSVLAGTHRLEDALVPYGPEGLLVLPSGPIPPNPSELLESVAMAELLNRLQNEADVVVLDSPPLLAVTDGAVLSSAADGVLLVVRAASTRPEQVDTALRALNAVHATLLGTVLNFADDKVDSPGYDYSRIPRTTMFERRERAAGRVPRHPRVSLESLGLSETPADGRSGGRTDASPDEPHAGARAGDHAGDGARNGVADLESETLFGSSSRNS